MSKTYIATSPPNFSPSSYPAHKSHQNRKTEQVTESKGANRVRDGQRRRGRQNKRWKEKRQTEQETDTEKVDNGIRDEESRRVQRWVGKERQTEQVDKFTTSGI